MRQIFKLSVLAFGIFGHTGPAFAQANANAVAEAGDAFGFKSGDDAVGIYDESSVRGFSLEAAGNYRVNGTYFVRNSGVSSFFLQSTTVRIGYNTQNSLLPGPSGVVDYRLRDPAKGEKSLATIGIDPFLQPYLDLNIRHRSSDDATSYSVGLGLVGNASDPQGGDGGHSLLFAGTLRHDIGAVRSRLFFGEFQYTRRGQFRILPAADALPDQIERRNDLGQKWSIEEGQRRIAGALLDWGEDSKYGAGASLVFSQEDPTRAFTQIFDDFRTDGSVRARIISNPQQRSTSWSGEIRTHGQWASGSLKHRLDVMLRGRRSRAEFGGSQIVALGRTDFGFPPADIAAPDLTATSANIRDSVDQWGVGLTYRVALGDSLRINAGILKTDYRKSFRPAVGAAQSNVATPWLYNLGTSLRFGKGTTLFGSYSRGLEEAGVAPVTANNRNQVLEAINVTQRELGIRHELSPGLALVIAGFDTRKPYIGIDSITGNFGPLGQVGHRGIEFSLAGKLNSNLNAVLGGVWIDPEIKGLLVTQGRIGNRPVAVPKLRAIANVDYKVPSVAGLSVDVGATYIAERPVRSVISGISGTQLESDASLSINLGVRYKFNLGQQDVIVRAQVLNLLNDYAWDVNSAETLSYSASRRAKVAVTIPF
ncbi:MAG: TonB-dependent receptor [Usitatibacteraceae bacterium]